MDLSKFKEIKSKKDFPEIGELVLAYFPNLSVSGLPFEIIVRQLNGDNRELYYLSDMRCRGVLAHCHKVTHWIYLKDLINIEGSTKIKLIERLRTPVGNRETGDRDNFPTTADPFGFLGGY